jgi:NADH:ubiquinone oxidoreductase subunit F (NADH-binding)
MDQKDIIGELKKSGLRGRGGAGLLIVSSAYIDPAARKRIRRRLL